MLHFTRNIDSVNFDLSRTNKLIICIGDSFTYGDSAWDEDLINKYPPQYIDFQIGYNHYDENVLKEINETYPHTTYFENGKLNFNLMFQSNSYPSLLMEKLNKEWTVLNLGVRARGNFSAVSSLFLIQLDWKKIKEMVVIYMPSSMNRVDVINDTLNFTRNDLIQNLFITAWPSDESTRKFRETNENTIKNYGSNITPWNLFQDSIYDSVWSTKYEIYKTILEFQYLKTWVESKNSKLIVIPAFSTEYNKDYFYKNINQNIVRDMVTRKLTDITEMEPFSDFLCGFVDRISWEDFYYPDGHPSFYHFALNQSGEYNDVNMLDLIGKPSKDNWIMACGHPSTKSHNLLADRLVENINDKTKKKII